jgi:hypothetical protein
MTLPSEFIVHFHPIILLCAARVTDASVDGTHGKDKDKTKTKTQDVKSEYET